MDREDGVTTQRVLTAADSRRIPTRRDPERLSEHPREVALVVKATGESDPSER